MRNEQDLWQYIQQGMPEVHWMRIESSVATGCFDVNACFAGIEAWIELKWDRGSLRPAQKAWGLARLRAGGNVWVLEGNPFAIRLFNFADIIRHGAYPARPVEILTLRKPNWPLLLSIVFDKNAAKERMDEKYSIFGV